MMQSWWGRYYIGAVSLVGLAVLLAAGWSVATQAGDFSWVGLAVLTLVAGSFAIKIPGVPALIYVSEAFVFTIVLLYGAGPAVLTFALDGLFVTLRRKNREAFRIAFNIAEPAISIGVAAQVLRVSGTSAAARGNLDAVVLPLAGMTAAYFLLNSWLNAFAVSAETGKPPHHVWRQHFLLLSLNCFAGASVALVLANASHFGVRTLGVVVPLVVVVYVAFQAAMGRVEDSNSHLKELNELYLSMLETLAMAIDAKDQVTHGHIRRVQRLALDLARRLGIADPKHLKAIEAAALLHDMGKLAVPEHILNKPGKLTPAEYDRMKLHASVGGQILSNIRFPYPIAPIVRHHHENWDGTGYPDGLAGTEIPLGARIMSVVDCYDALTSDRPYRPALAAPEALQIVASRKGVMYDPLVVDAFVRGHGELAVDDAGHEEPSPLSALIRQPFAEPQAEVLPPSRRELDIVTKLLALCDVAIEISGHASVTDVAETLARRVRALLPADCIVFYLADSGEQQLVAAHVSGQGEQQLTGLHVTIGEGLSGWVAAHRRTIVGSNPALDFGHRGGADLEALRSALAAPLIADGRTLGVLTLFAARIDAFCEDHRAVAEFAAQQSAAAIARALRFDADRAARLFDAATGLPNEKYLLQIVSSEALADARLLAGAGLISIGAPGSAAEDRLQTLAAAMRTTLRATDLMFRTGDCELTVLIPDAAPHLRAVAERMATVARHAFEEPVAVGAILAREAGPAEDLLEAVRRAARPVDRSIAVVPITT
jgi:putative nucleotidyltransferase with HDIG domain